ncbi:MAG: TIGR03862 family flavoprotein [Pseudolabrys sp.]|jgi:hypothetical protein
MRAAVIGGGPAGLMAAEVLARAGVQVTIYDQMPSLGRKFLLAGRGGLNLTHSEDLERFLDRYGDAPSVLRRVIEAFPPSALRAWSEELGQPTFVGSSGRVFPKAFKTSPLLRAWLRRLGDMGVQVRLRHRWQGWDEDGRLRFVSGGDEISVEADATILALGGASWPRLGSDAAWVDILRARDVTIAPLKPANCGFFVAWSDVFRRFEGQPLKRIAIAHGDITVRGEAMITNDGLEGGAAYALSARLRDAIEQVGKTTIAIDLMPDTARDALVKRLSAPRGKQSFSNFLRKTTRLAPATIGLLREAAGPSLNAMSAEDLAALIKAVPITLTGAKPLATAISTAGGIRFDELDDHFMLKKKPGVFAAGEMLDWEAPTGGYLLQASFATGAAAGQGALSYLLK